MLNSVIYIIRCYKSIKVYIGSAVNFEDRKNCHLHLLRNNKHQAKLQNAFNKYGKENFIFEILEFVEDKSKLIEREQYYLDTLVFAAKKDNRFDELSYNICRKAGSRLGVLHSEQSKLQMSFNKKEHLTEEHKHNISIGINASEKYKNSIVKRGANISKALMGHFVSEQSKEKNRIAHLNKRVSTETKQKQSVASKKSAAKEMRYCCEYCGKVVRKCTYVTYHADKCKFKLKAA